MSRLDIETLPLSRLKAIVRHPSQDSRGFFARIFNATDLATVGWAKPVAQINHSYSAKRGTVRGMHYQLPPHEDMKLVSCVRGSIWDVAIDLRAHSPTFLQHHAEVLSQNNRKALLIPEGFAHGFQTLEDEVELIYVHSAPYAPDAQGALNPSDPILSIPWPEVITQMSSQDANRPMLVSSFRGMTP